MNYYPQTFQDNQIVKNSVYWILVEKKMCMDESIKSKISWFFFTKYYTLLVNKYLACKPS